MRIEGRVARGHEGEDKSSVGLRHVPAYRLLSRTDCGGREAREGASEAPAREVFDWALCGGENHVFRMITQLCSTGRREWKLSLATHRALARAAAQKQQLAAPCSGACWRR